MKDVHWIRTLEALKAFSDPLRVRVVECLQKEPLTTAQIARQLGQRPNKLHYHVMELERNGLIEAVETRRKGNLIETYYLPTARVFRVDGNLFEGGSPEEVQEAFYQNVVTAFDIAAGDLKAAITAGKVTETEAAASLRTLLRWRLTPEDAAEFKARMLALTEEFGSRSRPEAPCPVALTLVFYAEVPQERDEGEPGTSDPMPAPSE